MGRTILAAELTALAVGLPMATLKKRTSGGQTYVDRKTVDKVIRIELTNTGVKVWYKYMGWDDYGWRRVKHMKDAYVMLAFDDGVEIEW